MKLLQYSSMLLLVILMTGCNAEPELTKVSGKITKNGQPVNSVQVRFVPVDETLGKYIGSGISDADGNFTIAIPGREGEVCCVGMNKVTVREAPLPGEIRGRLEDNEGARGGNALTAYKATLKNRPLPKRYERLHSTPLLIEVTPDQTTYDIEL